jgi:hypothetical protein
MNPGEIIKAFQRQHRRRLRWLATTVAIGLLVALTMRFAGVGYPAWKAGLLAFGILFWPWFLAQAYSKGHVSVREALSARAEMEPQQKSKGDTERTTPG